jgi:hypothetical protein
MLKVSFATKESESPVNVAWLVPAVEIVTPVETPFLKRVAVQVEFPFVRNESSVICPALGQTKGIKFDALLSPISSQRPVEPFPSKPASNKNLATFAETFTAS